MIIITANDKIKAENLQNDINREIDKYETYRQRRNTTT